LVFTKATKGSQFLRDRTDEVSPPTALNLLFVQFPGHSLGRGNRWSPESTKHLEFAGPRTKEEKAI